jgi:glycosyltransferase involved in cell wall biosynthesis
LAGACEQGREKLLLSRILRNPQLKTLFCLDPFAVKHLDKFQGYARAVYLPDPVQLSNNSKQPLMITRESLGIEPGRRVFLLFGSLTERKGVYQLLKAIRCLLPDVCQKICLLLVGESSIKASLENEIVSICQAQPVQIIRHYEFIPVQDVPPYFQLTDIVLTPYQRHLGMSAILPLAAATEKPVLSSNYGLMGEIVRRYELGLTVDSTIPEEIAKGLAQCLHESPEKLCDRTKMKSFAQQNSAQQFANTIFQHL